MATRMAPSSRVVEASLPPTVSDRRRVSCAAPQTFSTPPHRLPRHAAPRPVVSRALSAAAPAPSLAGSAVGASLETSLPSPLEIPTPGFDSIASALEAIAAGELVVVLDSEDRENEGDLIGAADRITTQATAFLVRHTSGVLCVGMRGEDLDRLRLPLMVHSAENEEGMYTAFTVSVDARHGITTGISAQERARTMRALGSPDTTAKDLRKPGHIFPLRARPGGVLQRPGHTEAGVDLTLLAGCYPAGALAEVVNDDEDGTMARAPQLEVFAQRHGLRRITIADLARYRMYHGPLVSEADGAAVPVPGTGLAARVFTSVADGGEHVMISPAGQGAGSDPPRVTLLAGGVPRCAAGAEADVLLLLDAPRQLAGKRLAAYAAQALGRAGSGDADDSNVDAAIRSPDLMQGSLAAHMLKSAGLARLAVRDRGLAAALGSHGIACV